MGGTLIKISPSVPLSKLQTTVNKNKKHKIKIKLLISLIYIFIPQIDPEMNQNPDTLQSVRVLLQNGQKPPGHLLDNVEK